jgi:hypothetical protein
MDSITEPIYEYTKQHCKHQRWLGTLTYPVMANLYKLTCFEKYPHFHVKAQNGINGTGLKTLISNSLSHGRGRTKGKGQSRSREKSHGKRDRQGKGNSKGRGKNQSNTNQSRGRDNSQNNQDNAGKRYDGDKTKEKGKLRWKQPICHYCEKTGHISRECPKRIADETAKTTTTNSSQQLTVEDDLDILFQNTLYVRSDDEESDDETMEEKVVYRPTFNMSQGTNNSDTVSTAQTTENHEQTEAKTTIMGDQSTLTFGGQDGTENSTNAQASFGDHDREIGQETIPPHCQIQGPPVPCEPPKTLTPPESEQGSNPERTKQTGNSRKLRRITGGCNTDD